MNNHQQSKDLYIKGNSITAIAALLGISRTSVYGYKNSDKAKNIDWDELKFLKATDSNDAQRNEEDFVALLIHTFEKALEDLNESEPNVQIETISKHIATYYKLKQQRDNVKVNKADIAKLVLTEISKIALAKEATVVIQFLSANADEIVSTVIKK